MIARLLDALPALLLLAATARAWWYGTRAQRLVARLRATDVAVSDPALRDQTATYLVTHYHSGGIR